VKIDFKSWYFSSKTAFTMVINWMLILSSVWWLYSVCW